MKVITDLLKVAPENRYDSFVEVIMIAASATIPLWFLYPIFAIGGNRFGELIGFWADSIKNGDFYLFATAMAGPLLYIILKDYIDKKEVPTEAPDKDAKIRHTYALVFPHGYALTIMLVLVCSASSIFFTIIKISRPSNFFTHLAISVGLYILTLVINFWVIAFKKDMANFAKGAATEEHNLVANWTNRP